MAKGLRISQRQAASPSCWLSGPRSPLEDPSQPLSSASCSSLMGPGRSLAPGRRMNTENTSFSVSTRACGGPVLCRPLSAQPRAPQPPPEPCVCPWSQEALGTQRGLAARTSLPLRRLRQEDLWVLPEPTPHGGCGSAGEAGLPRRVSSPGAFPWEFGSIQMATSHQLPGRRGGGGRHGGRVKWGWGRVGGERSGEGGWAKTREGPGSPAPSPCSSLAKR